MRSKSSPILAAVLALTLLPVSALGSWLQPHTRQEAIPAGEVGRSLVVGKSWLVWNLGFSWKHSQSHFVADRPVNIGFTEGTNFEKERNDGKWDYRHLGLGVSWGFSKNSDLGIEIPILFLSVGNTQMLGSDGKVHPIRSWGLGDMHATWRFQWLRTKSETGKFSNSLVSEVDVRFPTGSESPGSFIGGPNNVATILTGTGTWGWDVGLRFKQQLAVLAVEAAIGFTWNPTATVQYLIEDKQNQFNQHLDPGDVVRGNVAVTVQPVDPLAFRFDLLLDYRTPSRWGSTKRTFPACKECLQIPNSGGLWMDGRATVILHPTFRSGIELFAEYTFGGRRAFLWPLEELSPSRGITGGIDLSYRF